MIMRGNFITGTVQRHDEIIGEYCIEENDGTIYFTVGVPGHIQIEILIETDWENKNAESLFRVRGYRDKKIFEETFI